MFDSNTHKNLRVWKEDHSALRKQAAENDRQLIDEFSAIMRSNVRVINGKRYRIIPMDSDSLTGGNVRTAKMARSNRVGKDG